MNKENAKQAFLGFAEFTRGITGNQDLKIPDDIAKRYEIETDSEEVEKAVTTKEAYKLGKLDALNEIKEEIKNCIVHSPYFKMTSDCCHVRDNVMQIFNKHITKIEEE